MRTHKPHPPRVTFKEETSFGFRSIVMCNIFCFFCYQKPGFWKCCVSLDCWPHDLSKFVLAVRIGRQVWTTSLAWTLKNMTSLRAYWPVASLGRSWLFKVHNSLLQIQWRSFSETHNSVLQLWLELLRSQVHTHTRGGVKRQGKWYAKTFLANPYPMRLVRLWATAAVDAWSKMLGTSLAKHCTELI